MSGVLKKGSKGAEVSELQGQLNKLGFELTVDGDFGTGTEKAVIELQTAFGYNVDGVVGDGTKFLINQQLGYNWNVATHRAQGKAKA